MLNKFLLILALFTGISVTAQHAVKNTPFNKARQYQLQSQVKEQDMTPSDFQLVAPTPSTKSTSSTEKIMFGSSRNIFTSLLTVQNCIVYDKELDLLMATFRGNDKGTVMPLGTGDQICTAWSTDHGNTYTSKVTLAVSGSQLRYPSGVIYNPAGNTNLNEVFSVVAGPRTQNSSWDYTYFSSVQYNGNNFDVQQPATTSYKEMVRGGMSSCSDGTTHIGTMRYSTDYKIAAGIVWNGVYNTNTLKFDWSSVDIPVPFHAAGDQTLDVDWSSGNMAWSNDGSVGYFVVRGVDNRATGNIGWYPIIFKTIDKGLTWQIFDFFDFSSFPVIFDHVFSTLANPDVTVPFFSESDIVVDAAGNPHLMAVVQGHYSQHPDSLGFTYLYEVPSVFEFSFENGQWFCNYFGHLKTRDVSSANSPYTYTPDNQGWDMRMQASRTHDGSKVFAIWTDTDWEFWSLTDSINLYPDVFIWGRDINTNKRTEVKNVTFLEEGMGEGYFMQASNIAMDNAGVYDIPLFIEDINSTGLIATEPVYHYYLKGATFNEADFTISENKTTPPFSSVKNYPNPFNGQTTITVSLNKPATVSMVINSVTGQQVSKVDFGQQGAGTQNLTFDGSNLPGGVYFYTLTIGDQQYTNKMIKN